MHEGFDDLLADLVRKATVGQEVIGEVLARTSLRSPGPTTRAEISEGNPAALRAVDQRSIPQGTVSKTVKALISCGLLEEKGVKTADARWLGELYFGTEWLVAGVHVHRHATDPVAVTSAILRLDGTQVSELDTRRVGGWDDVPTVVLDQIAALAPAAIEGSGQPGRVAAPRLFAIGVEVGAPVADGVVYSLAGDQVDLAGMFRQRLGDDDRFNRSLPVIVENDVDALAVRAMSEMHYAEPDLAVVAVFDEGIGGGLVIDGRLRRGASGRSMEIGHLQVGTALVEHAARGEQGFSAKCLCGAYGHVDSIAPPARIRQELGVTNLGDAIGEQSLEVLTYAGTILGRTLSHVCNIINPSRLMLYVPRELLVSPPVPAGAYLDALRAELHQCFNTDDWTLEVLPLPADQNGLALLGVRAAAACVLQSFVEHALRLDGCQRSQHTAGMRKYMATTNAGELEVRHFAKPMTHAIDVNGHIWAFYPSEEEAERGAAQRRLQGHAVTVVKAEPYEPGRAFRKGDHPRDQLNVAGAEHGGKVEGWPFGKR